MHHHPDHVVYVIEGGKMKLTSMAKPIFLTSKLATHFF
jgi:hypothetical protein